MTDGQTWYQCPVIPGKALLVEGDDYYRVTLELRFNGRTILGEEVADIALDDADARRLAYDILTRLGERVPDDDTPKATP